MKTSWREALVLIGTALLALWGIAFGGYDALWNWTGTPAEVRGELTIGLAILILLIGHVLGSGLREGAQVEDINRRLTSFQQSLHASLSSDSGLRVFQTSDAALEYLTTQLRHSRKVWNTRVPAPGFGDYTSAEAVAYEAAMNGAIQRGVHFREVIGRIFEPRATTLSRMTTPSRRPVNYGYVVWDDPNAPFFNFIVIEDDAGVREVTFGWVITPVRGFEQECFTSRNTHLVENFVAMHEYMMGSKLPSKASEPADAP